MSFASEQELLVAYGREERQRGCREKGVKGRLCRVKKLLDYLKQQDLQFGEVRIADARAFMGFLKEQRTREGHTYKNSTINGYLILARNFFEFLKRRKLVSGNVFREIRTLPENKPLPTGILAVDEMNRLLDYLACYDREQDLKKRVRLYRLHVICELLYATGMRISEAANLEPADLALKQRLVDVREGKGGRSRICYLNEYCCHVLELYITKMRRVTFNEWNERNGRRLFGMRDMPMEKAVNTQLRRIMLLLGISRTITSHSFRHSLGYQLLKAGCNIRHIQSILGHKHLRHTEVYTRVDKEQLQEIIDRCHPRKVRRAER